MRTDKTRLIFFSFGILEQGGGFENYLMFTCRGLADQYKDLSITIVTMSPAIVEKLQHLLTIYFLRKQRPEAIYRETPAAIKKKLGDDVTHVRASSVVELGNILKENDVIYSKNEVLELAVLNRIGFKELPPVILGIHTPIYYPNTPSLSSRLHNLVYTGVIYRRLIKHVRSIQVNNADDLKLVRTKLRFSNVKVARQAFDIPKLKNNTPHAGKIRILFVGRLVEAKGINLLVDVIEALEHANPGSFEMKIAGSGDESIIKQVKELAQSIYAVRYLGHVSHDKISELFDWTDITIVTSEYETLNKVAIETAIAGKIAICTDIPGPREVIKDGLTGYLLPPDPQAFVKRITELAKLKASDPSAFQALGRAAYDYINVKFNAQKAYNEMHKEIINIVGRG